MFYTTRNPPKALKNITRVMTFRIYKSVKNAVTSLENQV